MAQRFHDIYVKCRSRIQDSTDQTEGFQSSIVQVWLGHVNCILGFLFLVHMSD